jgi:hypothetical protein
MALLSEALKDKEFDVRMVSRGIARGTLQRDDVEKQVKKLTDDTSNADSINLEVLLESVSGKSPLRS